MLIPLLCIQNDDELYRTNHILKKTLFYFFQCIFMSIVQANKWSALNSNFNLFVTSPGDLRNLGRPFRYKARRSPALIA